MNAPLLGSCFLIVVSCAASLAAADPQRIQTPYAKKDVLEIRRVVVPASAVRQYDVVETVVELGATFDNPFDPSDVALDAQVTLPDGKKQNVPGFFYQPFERKSNQGEESLTPKGEPSWRVRWTPTVAGAYSLLLTLRDRTGQTQSAAQRITVQENPSPGFLRISPRDRRYFEFDNGQTFFPIGLNLCWGDQKQKTLCYDAWIPAFGKAGCNSTRLWLSPGWNPFALERSGKPEEGLGAGQFDLAAAWRLDYVLEQFCREGIYVKFCVDSFNVLREKNCYPFWEEWAYNATHGGPLAKPTDFWTNAAMDQFYRNKLRYLVARYGASTHLLAWEFWNEVDITTEYPSELARDWHSRMARFLRSIDPYQHLITTSFAGSHGDPKIDSLPEIDFVETHLYGGEDPAVSLVKYQRDKEAYGKPHFVGEIGADCTGGRFEDDPEGVQIHDPLWITVASGGSGASQSWFWESIHAHKMHGLYRAISQFTSGIDWPGEQMHRIEPRLTWQQRPKVLPRKDLVIETTPPSFAECEFNQPRTLQVDRTGVHGQTSLAGIQHGRSAHPTWHNPVRLETDLPWATRFEVRVGGVSGWSGAALAIRLDGQEAVAKDFPNTNAAGDHHDLTQYAGDYGVDIPPGKHVVELENTGPDWFYCSYRLRDGLECSAPTLLAWATAGKNTAVAWVRLDGRSWSRVCARKEAIPASAPSRMTLPQMSPGKWKADIWDTWAGTVVQQQDVTVSADGEAAVVLPEIVKDLAVRIKRIEE